MIDSAVEEAFFRILDLEAGERRAALDQLDPAIRPQVESLLAADQCSDEFFARAVHSAAGSLDRDPGEGPSPVVEGPAGGLADIGPGAMLGAYRILGEIGRGGMGRVLLGERADGQYEQRVAIKVVNLPARYQSRFHRERQILAQLSHPNIARLLDGGSTASGLPYFVMELVENAMPIDEYCVSSHLKSDAIARLFLDVAAAVGHVHRSLIVHGDLKPTNILVDGSTGIPKLVDFGIARTLSAGEQPEVTGTVALSLGYASPEQVTGKPVTTATDIYGLCGVLYRSLTGEPPIPMQDLSLAECLRVICEQSPPLANSRNPEAGLDLSLIVDKGLRKDPAERYPSMGALRADLQALLDGRPVEARGPNAVYRFTRFLRRRWIPVSALALVFTTMAAAIVSIRGAAERAETERAIAVQARAEAESAMRMATQQRDRAEQMRSMAEAKSNEATEERVIAGKHLETQRQFTNAVTSLLDYEMLARNPEYVKIIDAWLDAQKQAVKQDPSNRNAQKLLGILHNRRGTQLFKRSPRAAEPDSVASVEILTRVAEAEPEDDWTQRNLMISLGQLGQVYIATLRPKLAVPVLQRAVDLSTRFRSYDPVFYLDQLASRSALADAYFATGQLEEGARTQEEAYHVWARRPAGAVLKGPTAYLLPISMQRMAKATRLRNPQRAAELMGRALGIMRDLAQSKNAGHLEFNEYANALNTCEWDELRKPDVALTYARKAVELTPKETRHLALDTLAWALFRKGDTAGAIASSREAISLLPAGFSMDRLVLEKSLKTFQDPASATAAK